MTPSSVSSDSASEWCSFTSSPGARPCGRAPAASRGGKVVAGHRQTPAQIRAFLASSFITRSPVATWRAGAVDRHSGVLLEGRQYRQIAGCALTSRGVRKRSSNRLRSARHCASCQDQRGQHRRQRHQLAPRPRRRSCGNRPARRSRRRPKSSARCGWPRRARSRSGSPASGRCRSGSAPRACRSSYWFRCASRSARRALICSSCWSQHLLPAARAGRLGGGAQVVGLDVLIDQVRLRRAARFGLRSVRAARADCSECDLRVQLLEHRAARLIGARHLAALGLQRVRAASRPRPPLVLLARGRGGHSRRHALQQLLQRCLPLLGLQHATLRDVQPAFHVGPLLQELRDLLRAGRRSGVLSLNRASVFCAAVSLSRWPRSPRPRRTSAAGWRRPPLPGRRTDRADRCTASRANVGIRIEKATG